MQEQKRTISLEVAQLLGIPFKWDGYKPMKYVHTDAGPILYAKYPDGSWVRMQKTNEEFIFYHAGRYGDPAVYEERECT